MSKISIHLKKQHTNGYDPDVTDDIETSGKKIPPLPSVLLMTTGFIENTRYFNTKTHNNMPVTAGRGFEPKTVDDDSIDRRPSNETSVLTAVSMQEAVTARDNKGTHVDPRAPCRFEEMGKMESGTYNG